MNWNVYAKIRFLPLILAILAVDMLAGCGNASALNPLIPTKVPTPDKPICNRSPPSYPARLDAGQHRVNVDIAAQNPRDTLVLYVGNDEIYRCRQVLANPLIGAGHLFSFAAPAGPVTIRLLNVTRQDEAVFGFDLDREKWLFITYYPDGRGWQHHLLDEHPGYE